MRASLLSFLFFCSSLYCAKAASVYIGALVNTESRVGREKKVAIEIAARHFNSSSSSLLLSVREFSSSADPLEIYTKGDSFLLLMARESIADTMHTSVVVQLKIS